MTRVPASQYGVGMSGGTQRENAATGSGTTVSPKVSSMGRSTDRRAALAAVVTAKPARCR